MDFLRKWVGMLRGVGLRNVLIVRLVLRSSGEHVFLSAHHMIFRENFLDYMKQLLTPEAFEALITAALSI